MGSVMLLREVNGKIDVLRKSIGKKGRHVLEVAEIPVGHSSEEGARVATLNLQFSSMKARALL